MGLSRWLCEQRNERGRRLARGEFVPTLAEMQSIVPVEFFFGKLDEDWLERHSERRVRVRHFAENALVLGNQRVAIKQRSGPPWHQHDAA